MLQPMNRRRSWSKQMITPPNDERSRAEIIVNMYDSYSESPSSATQAVLDYVRTAIREGELLPGHPLREQDLARRTGVGRSAIREAIRTLEAEGTLQRKHGHSAVVRQYVLEEVWAHQQITEVLEGLAASLAAKREEVHHHVKLVELLNEMAEMVAREDALEYSRLNEAFHAMIHKMSGNSLITRHLQLAQTGQLRVQASRFSRPDGLRISLAGHREIVAAIIEGDSAEAEKAMRKHSRGARQSLAGLPADLLPSKIDSR